nr:MAG TPA: pentapeptide repeat protein [Caudoviricetes sp.]
MYQQKINKALKLHKKRLNGPGGEKVNFSYNDLSTIDICSADFRSVDFRSASFRSAIIQNIDFSDANLCGVDFRFAKICNSKLCDADLTNADFSDCGLSNCDLSNCDLRNANFFGAKLSNVKLDGVIYNGGTHFFALQCPEEGSFIGWKKCCDDRIVKLLIPEDAKRSSATTRKCRCDKAKVLEIWDKNGNLIQKAYSKNDADFVYRIGETVSVPNFDEDRWQECAPGIHFFITRKEAEMYN